MSKAVKTPGILQRWLARPAPAFDDAADLGTAFGLEVSLDRPDQVPVLAAPAQSRRPGWVRRRVLRGGDSP